MIGRTNAAGGGKINGGVELLKVAPGQVVEKGDFLTAGCTLKRLSGDGDIFASSLLTVVGGLSNSELSFDNYGDELICTFCRGSSPTLNVHSIQGNVLVPVASTVVTGATYPAAFMLDNARVLAVFAISTTVYFRVYGISGSTMQLLKEVTVQSSELGSVSAKYARVVGNKFIRKASLNVIVFEVDDANNIHFGTGKSVSNSNAQIGVASDNTVYDGFVHNSGFSYQKLSISGLEITAGPVLTQPATLAYSNQTSYTRPLMRINEDTILFPTRMRGFVTSTVDNNDDLSFDPPYGFMPELGEPTLYFESMAPAGRDRIAYMSVSDGKLGAALIGRTGLTSVFMSSVLSATPVDRAPSVNYLGNNKIFFGGYRSNDLKIYYVLATLETVVSKAAASDVPYGIAIARGSAGQMVKVAVPG